MTNSCECVNKDKLEVRYQTIRKSDEEIEAKVIVKLRRKNPEIIFEILEITKR